MNASKENVRKCQRILSTAQRAKEQVMVSEKDAETLSQFLAAAERKLPSEAAFKRDRAKRRAKATA